MTFHDALDSLRIGAKIRKCDWARDKYLEFDKDGILYVCVEGGAKFRFATVKSDFDCEWEPYYAAYAPKSKDTVMTFQQALSMARWGNAKIQRCDWNKDSYACFDAFDNMYFYGQKYITSFTITRNDFEKEWRVYKLQRRIAEFKPEEGRTWL